MRRRTLLTAATAAVPAAIVTACSSGPAGAPATGTAESAATSTTTRTPTPTPTDPAGPSTSPTSPVVPRTVTARVTTTLATGLAVPWGIAFLPDGSALVSQRDRGIVSRITAGRRPRRIGTVPGVLSNLDQGGEAGLLGLAVHPDFPTTPRLYAYHSTATDNRVVALEYDGAQRSGLGRPEVVLDGIATSIHHNGGGLAFGPDGHLYVSTGDAEDPASAQDRRSLNGKILRVDVDTGSGGTDPVWSLGHRNVEGLAFDDEGRLWASEFGDKGSDELNRIARGGNYGWPEVEGRDGPGGDRDPLARWDTDACSPSGIAIAAGRAWLGALQGECLYSVILDGRRAGRIERHLAGTHGRIRSVAAAPDGSLWVGTSNRDGRTTPAPGDDRLLRVEIT